MNPDNNNKELETPEDSFAENGKLVASRHKGFILAQSTAGEEEKGTSRIVSYSHKLYDGRRPLFDCSDRRIVNLYNAGASSLPIDLSWKLQANSYFSVPRDCSKIDRNVQTESGRKTGDITNQNISLVYDNVEETYRDVIGEETISQSQFKAFNMTDSAPRERKKWVRPPLIGQAANDSPPIIQNVSSGDMGSNYELKCAEEEESVQNSMTERTNPLCRSRAKNEDLEECKTPYSIGNLEFTNNIKKKSSYFTSVCENSGVHKDDDDLKDTSFKAQESGKKFNVSKNLMMAFPVETLVEGEGGSIQDNTAAIDVSVRVPSPASVSSVTSSRRLEWDSGADVGYQAYRPEDAANLTGEGLCTLERFAISRGCSALRLEPEGVAGTVHPLSVLVPSLQASTAKATVIGANITNQIFRVPNAVSTPVDTSSTNEPRSLNAGIGFESEITPIVRLQREQCFFSTEGNSDNCQSDQENTSAQNLSKQNPESAEEEEYNILSRKISSSLINLTEHETYNDNKSSRSLPRSQSHLSLLSEKKTGPDFDNEPVPLKYQNKRNNGFAVCSVSSSSIATVVPKHDSPRIGLSDKLIQTSAFSVPLKQSIGVQVSEAESEENVRRSAWNMGVASLEDDSDSDIVDKTLSNIVEGQATKQFFNSKNISSGTYNVKSQTPHVNPRSSSLQKLLTEPRDNGSSVCKGAHKRGSNAHCCPSIGVVQGGSGLNLVLQGEIANGNPTNTTRNKLLSEHSKSSQDEAELKRHDERCGTLDSVASSTQTAGSWVLGDTTPAVNGSSGRRDSSGVVGSANSFEYLPGHIYENSAATGDQNLHKNPIIEYSSSQSESSHVMSDSKLSISSAIWGNSACSSLNRDLEKGVLLLKGLLDSKSYTSRVKKKLIRQVVSRLIETDYAEDSTASQKLPAASQTSVNGYIAEGSVRDSVTGGQSVRKGMERGEISGESAGEQQVSRNALMIQASQPRSKTPSEDGAYFVADKCVGTAFSGTSAPSSASEKAALSDIRIDSRAETTSTMEGYERSSTNTTSSGKSYSWKECITQSEKIYEHGKHSSRVHESKSVLLNLCETERENQLSWIRTEIRHLSSLKQLLEKQEKLSENLRTRDLRESPRKIKKSAIHYDSERSTLGSDTTHHSSIKPRSEASSKHISHHNIQRDSCLKEPVKLHGKRQFSSDPTIPKVSLKDVSSNARSVFTQMPSSSHLSTICGNSKNSVLEKRVPADSDSASNFSTFEVTAGAISNASGRINVHVPPKEGNRKDLAKEKETVQSVSTESKQDNLCCCECKKLLKKVISEVKHDKHRATSKTAVIKGKTHVIKGTNIESSNSSKNNTLSSSGTLRGLETDSSQYLSVAAVKNGIQPLPLVRPQCSVNAVEDKQCPCCGCIEEEDTPDMKSNGWKCSKCIKLEQEEFNRRCQICGILESEENAIVDKNMEWKCIECKQKEQENGTEKCNHCGKGQYNSSGGNSANPQDTSVSSHYSAIGDSDEIPRGYVLTVETTSPGSSTLDTSTKKPLQEIKIKVPGRKRTSVCTKETEQGNMNKQMPKSKPKSSSKENKKHEEGVKNKSTKRQMHFTKGNGDGRTLQEYLIANRPDFIRSAEYRRQCLDEIAYLRELRQKSKHKLIALASHSTVFGTESSQSVNPESIPPPPLAVKRVFSQRSMRAQTERKYHNLPEVLNKKADKKRKEDYRTNRLMAEIFAKKLQRKALRGEVNLSNSRSVISIV